MTIGPDDLDTLRHAELLLGQLIQANETLAKQICREHGLTGDPKAVLMWLTAFRERVQSPPPPEPPLDPAPPFDEDLDLH